MRWLEREIRKGGTGQKGIQEDGDGKRASKIFVRKDEGLKKPQSEDKYLEMSYPSKHSKLWCSADVETWMG